MITYKFADVLLVPFPFTNQESSKKRPAIVVSSEIYNQQKPDLILIAVTSQVSIDLKFGEMIVSDWLTAGLLKPSIIKPVIATIENILVYRKLGQLQFQDAQDLKNILHQVINLETM
jgi:mRNA interferase MazF